MNELENVNIQCPYCWEQFETILDCSSIEPYGDAQQYTEDCYVCCRPIVLTVSIDHEGETQIKVDAELSN